jgi:putative PEP-CTERM system TPR-repeat lipoprotein
MIMSKVTRRGLAACFGKAALGLFLLGAGGCDTGKTAQDYIKSAEARRNAGDIAAAIIDLKNALQKDPKNWPGRILLGQVYLDVPDPVAAEAEFLHAREDGADSVAIAKPLAEAELLLGRPGAALKEADVSPDSPTEMRASVLAVRAEALMALGRGDEARQALEAAAKLAPQSVDVLQAASRFALAAGDIATARSQLSEAQARAPRDPRLFDLEGAIAFAAEDFGKSIEAYKKMLGVAPWSLIARIGLARAQIADGKPQDADANLAIVLKAVPDATVPNYLRALSAYQQGDYATAQTYIRRTLNKAKNSPPALLLAGASSYALHQYEQANVYLNQYVYLVPQNLQARKLLATVQIALGHSADALKTLSSSIEKGSEDAQLLALIGTASAQNGDLATANRYFSMAVEQQPENTGLRTELGISEVALGQLTAGIQALEEASHQDPTAIRTEAALFFAYFRAKDYDKAFEVAQRLKKTHPDQAAGFNFAGAIDLAKGDNAAARAEFLDARKLRRGDSTASRALAALAFREGDLATASQYFNELIEASPKDAGAYIDLAALEEKQGRRPEMENTLQTALDQMPDNATLAALLGRLYMLEGKYREALTAVEPVLAKNPKDPALLEVVGQAQLRLGEANKALGVFGKLVELMPQASFGHRYLAETYLATNKPDLALIEAKKAFEADPGDPRAKLTLGRGLAARGAYDEARQLIDAVASDFPRDAGVADLRGGLALAQNRPDDAVTAYKTAVAENDNGLYRAHLAFAEARAGHVQEAESTLTQWLKGHPDDAFPRQVLGDIYLSSKRLDDAQSQYEAVLKSAPNAAIAENNIAWILYRKGDAQGALDHARHAVALAPDDPRVLDTYGLALLQNRFTSDAVDTLQKAVGAAPANPGTQFHFAQALAEAGEKDKARDLLHALLGKDQAFEEQDRARELLQHLGG